MTDESPLLQDDRSGAVVSDDEEYRYRLHRRWDPSLPTVAWIMLNPSTADATEDDPTIRRCIGFAKTWGYGEIVVGNLFALRSPEPSVLEAHPDPIGPENDEWLQEIVADDPLVVAAWGNGGALNGRGREVASALEYKHDVELFALGTTQDGHPWHPVRKPADLDPEPFSYGGDPA